MSEQINSKLPDSTTGSDDLPKNNLSSIMTWQTSEELNKLLPTPNPFSGNRSIERYGFLHVLNNICDLRISRRAFAEWVHGWIWDEHPSADILHLGGLPRDVTVIVRSIAEQKALINEGFQRTFVGGLPFSYIEKQHGLRSRHNLLAFPPHSAELEKITTSQSEYMDYLESIKNNYESIYVSIFYLDWNGPIHRAAEDRGLKVIQGARPDDAASLTRMRSIFDAFEQVTSNTMGSHFLYALYSGCRFSICGPQYIYKPEDFLKNRNPDRRLREKIDKIISVQQPQYLKARFGKFFTSSPLEGQADVGFAKDEIGERHRLTPEQIIDALGWSLRGQLAGYAASAIRRAQRLKRPKVEVKVDPNV
ncbi:hypothetical protein WIT60_12230 [Aquabacterium sp. G14]|uniref:hypothetical protein n=1 Tax=Aquabacterium sp. G14 TaxID=3130164 RepID=UPI0030B36528